MLHIHVQPCTCQPDGFCIAPHTIAYAKVSGADCIAWRTQLHLTPAAKTAVPQNNSNAISNHLHPDSKQIFVLDADTPPPLTVTLCV